MRLVVLLPALLAAASAASAASAAMADGAAFPAIVVPFSETSSPSSSSSSGATTLIPATDPRLWHSGRTNANSDGSMSFDWEGVAFYINTVGCSFVDVVLNTTGPMTRITGQLYVSGQIFSVTRQFVSPRSTTNVFRIADNLDATQNYTIRVLHELEPAFSGAAGGGFFTFLGFSVDGTAGAPTPFTRRLEVVGDSITAGYGSQCAGGGPVMDWTSGWPGTWSNLLCDHFQASCNVVAWSGKGMYENCCDNGETMPGYYLQTFGGQSGVAWDFTTFIPEAILINLGTNDFNHDSGPAWEANFTSTYVAFVLNATRRYGTPAMPVFLAQGPMNNGAPLFNALQAAITQINAAGGNAHFLDMRGPPCDGCGGHPGIVGHQGMATMAKPVIASVMGWTWQPAPGFVSVGGDVLPAATMAVDAAKALCIATPGCLAITYANPSPAPSTDQLVYFKNHSDVGAGDWFTYINVGA